MSKMVELNFRPDEHMLRQFGFIALVGFGLLAAMAYFERMLFAFGLGDVRMTVVGLLVGIGGASALLSLVYPWGNWPLFVSLSVVSFPIGFVLSHIILGALFFLLIAPVAIVFRVVGRDSMRRRYDSGAPSYWSEPRPARGKESYFRQF